MRFEIAQFFDHYCCHHRYRLPHVDACGTSLETVLGFRYLELWLGTTARIDYTRYNCLAAIPVSVGANLFFCSVVRCVQRTGHRRAALPVAARKANCKHSKQPSCSWQLRWRLYCAFGLLLASAVYPVQGVLCGAVSVVYEYHDTCDNARYS